MTPRARNGLGGEVVGTPGDERIGLLDCLRGLALFGVLFVNMAWFAAGGLADTPSAVAATASADRWIGGLMQLFVYAKANTLFTLLFGIGFSIQVGRLESRRADAVRVYVRRLVFLLAVGALHLFALWQGEILHIYALAGFALLPWRRCSTGVLLAAALVLILVVHPLLAHWSRVAPLLGWPSTASAALSQAEAARFDAFVSGTYTDVVNTQWHAMVAAGYFGIGLLAWVAYALGRFLVGVCLARTSVLVDPGAHARSLWYVALLALPLGVALTLSRWLLQGVHVDPSNWPLLLNMAQLLGTIAMTASYVAWLSLGWTHMAVRRRLEWFTPVGRMALTNYLAQTVLNIAVFFGLGLGLVARVGITFCLGLSIALYALQVIASRWWLRSHPFGPVEWLWRWWTYRRRPAWHIAPRSHP